MLLLVNSTKLMDLETPAPKRPATTDPDFSTTAGRLIKGLRKLNSTQLMELMSLSEKLAGSTRADLTRWGRTGQAQRPAILAFTGLVYQHLDARSFTAAELRFAQARLRILSGLYGLLRPLDLVEAYRLEMGCRFDPKGGGTLVGFWQETLTGALNAELKEGEAIVSVAAQEYLKALDPKKLRGPVIEPVFKEQHADGTLKNAPVYAKQARGALLRFAIRSKAKRPRDLLGFGELEWEATCEPPSAGKWLFTRPVRR